MINLNREGFEGSHLERRIRATPSSRRTTPRMTATKAGLAPPRLPTSCGVPRSQKAEQRAKAAGIWRPGGQQPDCYGPAIPT